MEPLSDPWRQIRLIQIQPGDQEEILSMNIFVCNLHKAPSYKAISYTWRNNDDTIVESAATDGPSLLYGSRSELTDRELLINGRTLRVKENCYYALWQARLHFQSCLVWIDSICINQEDETEKSCQVSSMGRIYKNASQVLACIGPHSEDSQRLAYFSRKAEPKKDRLKDIARRPWWIKLPWWLKVWFMKFRTQYILETYHGPWQTYMLTMNLIKYLASGCRTWVSSKISMQQEYIRGLTVPFHSLARRRYWSRLWIIQELVNARQILILCGEHSFPWSDVLLLERMIKGVGGLQDPSSVFSVLEETIRSGTLSIEESLVRFSSFGCKDPRDRYFGLLSVLQLPHDKFDQFRPYTLPADYSISAFGWVVKIVEHIPFSSIPRLLAAFEVDASSTELQDVVKRELRNQKFGRGLRKCGQGDLQDRPPFTPLIKAGFCRVDLDKSGNLTAALEPDTTHQESLSSSDRPLQSSKLSKLLESGDAQHILGDQCPEKIMVDGRVAAIVCEDTCVGDILLPIIGFTGGQIIIVVRHAPRPSRPNGNYLFDIVGQGFVIDGYRSGDPGDDSERSPASDGHIFHRAGICIFKLHTTPENTVAFIGQDLKDEKTYDVRGRVERLVTGVTSFPKTGIMIESTWCAQGACAKNRLRLAL